MRNRSFLRTRIIPEQKNRILKKKLKKCCLNEQKTGQRLVLILGTFPASTVTFFYYY